MELTQQEIKKLKIKTALQNVVMIFLTLFLFFGSIILFGNLIPTNFGIFIGFIVGMIIFLAIIAFVFPVIFKDYIEYFWAREEEKKCLERELEKVQE